MSSIVYMTFYGDPNRSNFRHMWLRKWWVKQQDQLGDWIWQRCGISGSVEGWINWINSNMCKMKIWNQPVFRMFTTKKWLVSPETMREWWKLGLWLTVWMASKTQTLLLPTRIGFQRSEFHLDLTLVFCGEHPENQKTTVYILHPWYYVRLSISRVQKVFTWKSQPLHRPHMEWHRSFPSAADSACVPRTSPSPPPYTSHPQRCCLVNRPSSRRCFGGDSHGPPWNTWSERSSWSWNTETDLNFVSTFATQKHIQKKWKWVT